MDESQLRIYRQAIASLRANDQVAAVITMELPGSNSFIQFAVTRCIYGQPTATLVPVNTIFPGQTLRQSIFQVLQIPHPIFCLVRRRLRGLYVKHLMNVEPGGKLEQVTLH